MSDWLVSDLVFFGVLFLTLFVATFLGVIIYYLAKDWMSGKKQ